MKLIVEFDIIDQKIFEKSLMEWDLTAPNTCNGYRIDEGIEKRESLRKFATEMEAKLRKNDWKSDWREKPVQALIQLLHLEFEEFKALYAYFPTREARRELVDIANFSLIVYDRMGALEPDVPAKLQEETEDEQRARYFSATTGTPDDTRAPKQPLSSGIAYSLDNSEVVRSVDPE